MGTASPAIFTDSASRTFARTGWMDTAVHWTEACVGVALDEAINDIAAWVPDKEPSAVYLADD